MRPPVAVISAAVVMLLLAAVPVGMGGPAQDAAAAQGADPVRLLIITSPELRDSLSPLLLWKNRLGIPSEIVTVEDAIDGREGADDAERLFDYVSERYSSSGGNLTYLVLGGGPDVVPVRYLHAGAAPFDLDDEYLSDVYYASPGADWDPDGDGLYGEPDGIDPNMTFPIAVGRIPASDPGNMTIYVNKVIAYESDPPEGDWTERAVMASSLMDRPNITDDPATPEDEGFDPVEDNGRTALERLRTVLPYRIESVEVQDYPFYWGMNYSKENDTLVYGTLPALISEGCGAVTFAGQSFYDADVWDPPTAYSLAQWFDPAGSANGSMGFQPALSSEDLPGLSNGGMLPVAYFSSCDSANFSDPTGSDLSRMVLARDGGAICMIGSTGVSWRGEYSEGGYGNWYLLPAFWERFYGTDMPGRSLYDLKEAYLRSYFEFTGFSERVLANLYGYNYIGDPSLVAWTSAPLAFGMTYEPVSVHAGGEEVTVTVTNKAGAPVSGARVSICFDGSLPFVGTTGPDGKASVQTSFPAVGTAHITASARGYLPSSVDIPVLAQPPDPSLVEGSLSVYPERPTSGSPLSVSAEICNEGGQLTGPVSVGLFDSRPEGADWPAPIVEKMIVLAGEGPVRAYLNVSAPDRTWRSLTIGVRPAAGEIDLSDNLVTFPISVNGPPLIIGGGINVTEDESAFRDLGSLVFDPDTPVEELTFVLGAGVPEWVEVSSGHFLGISPPRNWSGDLDVPLRVSDGLEHAEGDVTISVLPVNDPPAIRGLPERVTAYVDRPLIIPLDLEDAEGGALTVRLERSVEGLMVSGYALRIVPGAGILGDHDIEVNVSDPDGAFTVRGFTLTVLPPKQDLYFQEPSVHLPDAMVGERYVYAVKVGGVLAANATFADNTTLFEIDPSTGNISFVPTEDDVGEHWIRITVTSGNETASRSFVLVVAEEEDFPTWIVWALASIATVLLVLILMVYMWGGRKVPQYGEE